MNLTYFAWPGSFGIHDYLVAHVFNPGNTACSLYGGDFLFFGRNSACKISRAVSNRYLDASDRTVVNGLVYFEFQLLSRGRHIVSTPRGSIFGNRLRSGWGYFFAFRNLAWSYSFRNGGCVRLVDFWESCTIRLRLRCRRLWFRRLGDFWCGALVGRGFSENLRT